ncbi:MAG: PDZ domain-containing protein [Oscillospiraceae bacterium]|jgi:carboxyl-terminal processing protease|nr:PDZ domain-containing protein [Oscillospiraceae bacterium]
MSEEQATQKKKEPAKILLGMAIALILAAIAATVTITMAISNEIYSDLIKSLNVRMAMYDIIKEIDDIVRISYYGNINNIDHTTQLEIGYIKGIGDSKSQYFSPAEYKAYKQRMKGDEPGAGFLAQYDAASDGLLVTRVFASSPAAKSGLKTGDVIKEIAGTAAIAQNTDELLGKFKGGTLSSVQIKYSRGGKENTARVMLGYSNPTVVYELQGNIGYVRIFAFYEKTAGEVNDAIEALQKKSASAVVFDVRGVNEGKVDYAAAVLKGLCPMTDGSGALAALIGKDDNIIRSFPSDAKQVQMQMAVLINGHTAGAAELFACDLRDFGKAVLVGEKTAGDDTAQDDFALKDGGGILLTIAKVRPYRTESYAEGLTPYVEVMLTDGNGSKGALLPLSEDAQAQAAFSLYKDQSDEDAGNS